MPVNVRPPLLHHLCLLLALALVPALVAAWLHPRRPDWATLADSPQEISVSAAMNLAQKKAVLWIDARSQERFEAAHIADALSLNEERWESGLQDFAQRWQPGMSVIVYCDQLECHSSRQLARRMHSELGVDQVFVLTGGWQAWKEAQR